MRSPKSRISYIINSLFKDLG